jgi:putative hydrolase of the HAD superfamily
MNAPLKAVLFDYGNTLIAFGPEQQAAQSAAMINVLQQAGRTVDAEALDQLRHAQVMRPYERDGIENDFTEVCREVVELTGPDEDGSLTQAIARARQTAFIASVKVASNVVTVLEELSPNYSLGVLSNYPCTHSIVESLRHLDLLRFFPTVVVSGDVGYAKPHPATYEALLAGVGLQPQECVYVGDNWLADIQGAKRAGMRAVWIREHIPYEFFDQQEGDTPADAEIVSLTELPAVLESWA